MLKFGYNTTRPAPWDSRLGFQVDPRPLCVPITGLSGEGGVVGALDTVIVRKYPVMVGSVSTDRGDVVFVAVIQFI